jgi:hypothetical protein
MEFGMSALGHFLRQSGTLNWDSLNGSCTVFFRCCLFSSKIFNNCSRVICAWGAEFCDVSDLAFARGAEHEGEGTSVHVRFTRGEPL